MTYKPTRKECISIFRLVNLLALNSEVIEPKFKFPSAKTMTGAWGYADFPKGTSGIIELCKEYPTYILFVKVLIHEIGHLWVWYVKRNRKETHGPIFKEYCELIEARFGISVLDVPWKNSLTGDKD